MRRVLGVAALALGVSACPNSDHPGNDREAELDRPEPPAQLVSVGAATANVAPGALFPQTMTEADLTVVPAGADRCVFRFTRDGLVVLSWGESAVVKLNGKLVLLPSLGEGEFAGGPVSVALTPLEGSPEVGETFEARLVLRVAGEPDERGYHGVAECSDLM